MLYETNSRLIIGSKQKGQKLLSKWKRSLIAPTTKLQQHMNMITFYIVVCLCQHKCIHLIIIIHHCHQYPGLSKYLNQYVI